MHLLSLSLPTPAENLALDEALLEQAEAGELDLEVLRLWPAQSTFAVIGRGSRIATEINLPLATAARVPIFRRVSGGAAIVAAQGCLMYSLLLSYEQRPHLRMLDVAHRCVMETLVAAISPLEPRITTDGTCDLVVEGKKVSGNSLRCRRDWMLYHGTLLVGMDLSLIDQFLLHPPREPEYRQGRLHADFVANMAVDIDELSSSLARQWHATEPLASELPYARIERLVHEKYTQPTWTFER